jgi:hypothetical protein
MLDSKLLLAGGITFFGLTTTLLIFLHVDKEYVLAFSGFLGQLVAAFLTYINSNRTKPPEV